MRDGEIKSHIAARALVLLVFLCTIPVLGMISGCAQSQSPSEPGETGTVVVDSDPDHVNAPWVLSGPGDYSHSGSGDETLTDRDVGEYTLTWQDVAGYVTPSPNPEMQTLGVGGTVTFAGTYEEGGVEPEMVLVPAGTFIMGDGVAPCGEDEHQVTLTRDFYLGQHEVTNREYKDALQWAYDQGYVTATTSSVLDNLDGSSVELLDLDGQACEIAFVGGTFSLVSPDHPVKQVAWCGAARYCDWLDLRAGLPRAYDHNGDWLCNGGDPYGAAGYRLPTDAEWEYAAQYDDERIYPWGNETPDCSRANYDDCAGLGTTPVGSYPDAPATLGLSDMAGNVWEWCNDVRQCDLGTAAQEDPVGPASGYHVLRGGCWHYEGFCLRCAFRPIISPNPDAGRYNVGFRVARTVTP